MFKKISSKSIFSFLILIILSSFVITYFLPKVSDFSKDNSNNDQNINKSKKVLGAKIYKENKNGEKFIIIAETLKESETQDKRLELENSITTINKKGVVTKIHAGFAIITNEYNDFNLSKKVKIIKKSRQFLLETNSLIGTLKEGNFFTNERVAILAGNTKINGEGLDLKNNGDYIKIKGKATLVMLLSNKWL